MRIVSPLASPRTARAAAALVGALALAAPAGAQGSFVNFETPHVHPLDLTPDGTRLLAVNTADNRLLVYDVGPGGIAPVAAIPVGLDPVSVRARTDDEVWVVNHLSDSVSVVSLAARSVVATLDTGDEPADVVFAGGVPRAFVSCSQVDEVWVFDPSNLAAPPAIVPIVGQDPRALAVSGDGATVYAAIFESGNRTTVLGGGVVNNLSFPPNVVSDPAGPYGGQNPRRTTAGPSRRRSRRRCRPRRGCRSSSARTRAASGGTTTAATGPAW